MDYTTPSTPPPPPPMIPVQISIYRRKFKKIMQQNLTRGVQAWLSTLWASTSYSRAGLELQLLQQNRKHGSTFPRFANRRKTEVSQQPVSGMERILKQESAQKAEILPPLLPGLNHESVSLPLSYPFAYIISRCTNREKERKNRGHNIQKKQIKVSLGL